MLGLCNNLGGWEREGGGREVQEGGIHVHLWLIHVDVWQKSNQYCKVVILQLKMNSKKEMESKDVYCCSLIMKL